MSAPNDPLLHPSDISAALGLLTRLPIPVDGDAAQARSHRAPWAYPLAGLAVAVITGFVAQAALWLALPPQICAGLALATGIIITGALHEDGLADAADGLWGGWTPQRRLEIMKDSRIGAYGVLALIVSLGLRWHALAFLFEAGFVWQSLIASAMLSRSIMVPLMARLPHARKDGLSHSVGRPSNSTSRIAEILGLLAGLVLWAWIGLVLFVVTLLMGMACALIARAKVDGQTGDILGATGQLTEITLLLTLVAFVAPT